jgi:hypothetical protein
MAGEVIIIAMNQEFTADQAAPFGGLNDMLPG